MDDSPMNPFLWRVTAFCAGGFLLDGYILGIIGSALALMGPSLGLSAVTMGLIAASSLIGIFVGGIAVGRLVDRMGRQKIFLIDLTVFLVASLLQLLISEPWQLIALRFIMGVAIGADFVIGMTLLAEFAPRRWRGVLLGSLNVIGVVGFALAFVFGEILGGLEGDDAWRWMLASSAVPTVIVLLLRLGAPESPRWLASKGRADEAQAVLDRFIGPGYVVGEVPNPNLRSSYRALFTPNMWRRTIFAGGFWACQVLPFFAVYMFLPQILNSLGVEDGFTTQLYFNVFLVVGAAVGLPVMQWLPRRVFLSSTFALSAMALTVLAFLPPNAALAILIAFVVFAVCLSAATNLLHCYPGELSYRTARHGRGFRRRHQPNWSQSRCVPASDHCR